MAALSHVRSTVFWPGSVCGRGALIYSLVCIGPKATQLAHRAAALYQVMVREAVPVECAIAEVKKELLGLTASHIMEGFGGSKRNCVWNMTRHAPQATAACSQPCAHAAHRSEGRAGGG